MSASFRQRTIEVRRLTPAEAEVWIRVEVEGATPTTEIRGRLMGPRCPGVTTIEVAYALHPIASSADVPTAVRFVRALIPEPNLWTAETPLFYEGVLELWQDGRRCEVEKISLALKKPG
jgi:hypothetical protein